MKFKILKKYIRENNIVLDENGICRAERFAELLIKGNSKANLTAITDPEEIEIKHIIDSVAAVNFIRDLLPSPICFRPKILDVGCGAGLPGVPLSFCLPWADFTLLDSNNKKIRFLNDTIDALKIKNACAICERAEDFINLSSETTVKKTAGDKGLYDSRRECFDIAVSRAVAKMRILLEYCLPFVKVGGFCIFYKSEEYSEEVASASNALKILGGEVQSVKTCKLPKGFGHRSIIIVKKINSTPEKFPRRTGVPAKRPL